MTLTAKQLTSLRHDLVSLATIEHDDVLNELLDHYASLTERKMEKGMSFDEASKWAWAEMGSGTGIQRIQTTYERSIREQVSNQHLRILKNYFRWPTLVTTVLVIALLYLVVPLLSAKAVIFLVLAIVLCPLVALCFGYFTFVDQRLSTGKIIWQYMLHKGFLPLNFLQLSLNLPNAFFDSGPHPARTLLQQHPTIAVVICLVCLLYTVSFLQLYWHKFHLKIA